MNPAIVSDHTLYSLADLGFIGEISLKSEHLRAFCFKLFGTRFDVFL